MVVTTILTFGDLIRQHRIKAKLSLNDLASLSNVHKGTISKIENGEVKKPEFKTLRALSEALNIPYDEYTSLYIDVERSPEFLILMLNETIEAKGSIPLISKIANKFLEAERADSYESTSQLFKSTCNLEDTDIKLALFKTIIRYSRGHGVVTFLARSLYQEYLIERNDFSKLKATYESGVYVLKYTEQLPPEERTGLYYRLAAHAYSLRKYSDCIQHSKALLEDEYASKGTNELRAHVTHVLRGSYYHLGEYVLAEKYAEEYKKCFPSIEGDNDRLIMALLNVKNGNKALAVEQFEKCLQLCSASFTVHIVIEYMAFCFEHDHIDKIKNLLLTYEGRIHEQIYSTPLEKAGLARFYKLKGDYYTEVNDVIHAISSYIKGAYAYASINNIESKRSCLQLFSQLSCFSWVYSRQS
ncbi:helix-turn-helix domain-containing protein [Paenibacillus assamensis]|uniref:helix-turn-helix domain-containing protein n=1 Tax=Paenibacillus assamensis TaxID=311244 RepID=UPI0003FDBDCD|nr:helix-turn-helix transcriptional regulator [Paenibacillus assamensis]